MSIQSREHCAFPIPFTILTAIGIWYPENWPKKKKPLFDTISGIILVLGMVLTIEMAIKVIITFGSEEFDIGNLFALTVFLTGLFRMMNMMYSHEKIVKLIDYYIDQNWYKPENAKEKELQKDVASSTR